MDGFATCAYYDVRIIVIPKEVFHGKMTGDSQWKRKRGAP